MKTLVFMAVIFLSATTLQKTWAREVRRAPEIKGKVWFNVRGHKELTMKALGGKVVLFFFWTPDDSNCTRAVSVLKHWYERYQEKGLEIIGVYTPEWEFKNTLSEVIKKIDALGVRFPVVVDDDSSLRRAYGQQLWPSFSFVDRDSYIRAEYNISLNYQDMEIMLRELLDEKGVSRHIP